MNIKGLVSNLGLNQIGKSALSSVGSNLLDKLNNGKTSSYQEEQIPVQTKRKKETPPPPVKDNTMLYVGGAIGAVILLKILKIF